jgi:hypothetical protein
MRSLLLRSFLALLASLLAACSSFDQHWRDAAQGKGGATRWDGHWQSGQNKYANGAWHHGRLRCVLEPVRVSEYVGGHHADGYHAYFHANWLIFSGNYDMSLRAVGPRRGKVRRYEGSHDLPAAFGGTYHYQATITGNTFKADYTCKIDHGLFDLQQVPPGK